MATAIDNTRLMSKKEANCLNLFYIRWGLPLSNKQENTSLSMPSSTGGILLSHLSFPRSITQLSDWRKDGVGFMVPLELSYCIVKTEKNHRSLLLKHRRQYVSASLLEGHFTGNRSTYFPVPAVDLACVYYPLTNENANTPVVFEEFILP